MSSNNKLQHTLKNRHITMIALGGAIGAGLFVGSGALIASAGPAAILSYVFGGIIVTLVMFMLGELAARNPDSGSFSTYASNYLGEWAGYAVGWLYWFKWMVSITLEALLLGAIIHDFIPPISLGVATFAMLALVIAMNIYSVNVFGELEYWLAFLKVAVIVAFLILGVSILMGWHNDISAPGWANLMAGDFLPNGISPVLAGVTIVTFAFGGSEIAAIAAGESENPKKNIIKAIHHFVWRILIFYIGSVTILVLCIPWTDKVALQMPYVALFNLAGFPVTAMAMKMLLFISFLSVMNAGMYSSSRMLFSLSQRGYAPTLFGQTTQRGIPLNTLVLAGLVCSTVLALYFLYGGDFFQLLAKSSGSLVAVVWLFIALSHLAMRRRLASTQDDESQFKAWFYPYSNWIVIVALITIMFAQAFNADSRFHFWITLMVVGVVMGTYFIRLIIRKT